MGPDDRTRDHRQRCLRSTWMIRSMFCSRPTAAVSCRPTTAGTRFTASNGGFSARQVVALKRDANRPATLFVGVVNDKDWGGVFESDNGGGQLDAAERRAAGTRRVFAGPGAGWHDDRGDGSWNFPSGCRRGSLETCGRYSAAAGYFGRYARARDRERERRCRSGVTSLLGASRS